MADKEEEEVGDSWEDIEEEDLIRRLTNRQQELSKQPKQGKSEIVVAPVSNERTLCDGPVKIKYSEGSEYVAPIKLLKRQPENDTHSASIAPTEQHRTQKSLAEREAEYASARARILGNDNTSSSTARSFSEKKLIQRNSHKT